MNKVLLKGFVGKGPDLKFAANGLALFNCSLATTDSWIDDKGEKKVRTEWHKLVFFSKLAEVAAEQIQEGTKLFVEGSNQTNSWVGQDGVKRKTTQVKVKEFDVVRGVKEKDFRKEAQEPESYEPPSFGEIPV